MDKYTLYYHAGSGNHGCEAIVRATNKILGKELVLNSSNPEEDLCYGLDLIVKVTEDVPVTMNTHSLGYYKAAISHKLTKNDYEFTKLTHKPFFDRVEKNQIYFSIGGDNYCYKGRNVLGYYNKCIHRKGGKTVLWGCSCGPDDIDKSVAKDLALYDLIVARESISYEALKKVNPNTVLLPDPAFQLGKINLPLPVGFEEKVVGINLSPLILEYGDGEIIYNSYKKLLTHILDETDYKILLVPHVVKDKNDDRIVLQKLYSEFSDMTERIALIDDCNCMELKGYISRCDLFIGARTHATIAAYSTCVPTLVVGYSIKSIGIARELFGTDKDYVIPVQKLTDESVLVKNFDWLVNNADRIRHHLNNFMPEYRNRILSVIELLEEL